MRKNCPVRVDKNTKNKLKNWKRQLESIENKDIALGEIIERMSKGEDMFQRLKMGAIERRRQR